MTRRAARLRSRRKAGHGRSVRVHHGLRQALAREFHHSEAGDFGGSHARAVFAEEGAEMLLHLRAVFFVLHVDEVHHHESAEVAAGGVGAR